MEYAINRNSEKILPSPNSRGVCPECDQTVISRCGNKNVWHWAHLVNNACDYFDRKETDWHKKWKSYFDIEHIEVRFKKCPICGDEMNNYNHCGIEHKIRGNIKISDVRTDRYFIEFQHSSISVDELTKRESYYKKDGYDLIWVFNNDNYRTYYSDYIKNGFIDNGESLTVISKDGYNEISYYDFYKIYGDKYMDINLFSRYVDNDKIDQWVLKKEISNYSTLDMLYNDGYKIPSLYQYLIDHEKKYKNRKSEVISKDGKEIRYINIKKIYEKMTMFADKIEVIKEVEIYNGLTYHMGINRFINYSKDIVYYIYMNNKDEHPCGLPDVVSYDYYIKNKLWL